MGKKSGPAPPPAPDPVAVTQAQASANKDAAIQQATLNRIDQYTPQGSSQYVQYGTTSDGTPQYAQYTQYSPAEQAKYDAENNITMSLDGLAQNNIGRVNAAQAAPFSFDGMTPLESRVGYNLPGMQQSGALPDQQRSVDMGSVGQVQGTYNTGGNIKQSIDPATQPLQYGVNGGPVQSGYQQSGPLSYGVDAGDVHNTFAGGGDVGFIGNNAGGRIQRQLNTGSMQDIPGLNDFGAEADKVGDAVYNQATSRLNPQFAQQNEDLTARLANQGISNNSDAYRTEMQNFNNTKTDAYNQANFSSIQARAAEQQRLFNQALAARGQQFGEAQTKGQFANSAQGQAYSQNANTVGANNAAQGQIFGQNNTLAQFYNSAQGQQFAQRSQNAALNNSAQAQNTQDNANRAQFANAAQGQQFAQGQQNASLNNSTQQQQFGQNAQSSAFQNTAQAQQNQQNQQAAAFGNQAQDTKFQQAQSLADLFNSTGQQNFANQQSAAGFDNQARGQAFNEQLTNANLANAGRQQQIQESSYLRNLPLNEIAALLGTGNGVQNPTFGNVSQVGVAAPDYQGAVYANYNGANQQYQAQQQARSQMLGSIFGSIGSIGGAAMMASDRRVKEDITRVGTLPNGIATYAFNYIGDKVRQFGVMAQEVMHVIPDAVNDIDGILHVDYGKVYA